MAVPSRVFRVGATVLARLAGAGRGLIAHLGTIGGRRAAVRGEDGRSTRVEEVNMATVGLVGTLDTKREEYTWLRDALTERGVDTVLIDVGTFSDGGGIADVGAAEVAQAAGADIARLRDENDRGAAMTTMGQGAAAVVERLHAQGKLHGL